MEIDKVILFQLDKTSKIAKMYSQREFDRMGIKITVEQWILLTIVNEFDGLTQKELAEKSFRDPASITRTLDLLNERGFIERKSVPNDRRQYNICLKQEGTEFIKQYLHIIETHRANSIEGLSDNDLKELDRILKKMQQNMS